MTWSQFRDVLPVITFLIGLIAAPMAEALRERRADKRTRARDLSAFERDVLLQAQDALTDYWGTVQDYANAKMRGDLQGHGWSDKNVPEKLQNDWWWKQVHAITLRVRIDRPDLRGEVREFMSNADAILGLPDAARTTAAVNRQDRAFEKLQENIGDRLRSLYTAS